MMIDEPERSPRFEQRHITVPRSARYAILGAFDAPLREVWIVCHGHGQLASRFLSRFRAIESEDRIFIAPEALSRYYLAAPGGEHGPDTPVGATWMTREDRDSEIADYVRYLDLLHDEIFSRIERAGVRLVVLGFSQGVATAARWVARGKPEPDRVILWAGVVPPEMTADGLRALSRRAPVVLCYGDADEYATNQRVESQRQALERAGAGFEIVRFPGRHEIPAAVLQDLARNSRVG